VTRGPAKTIGRIVAAGLQRFGYELRGPAQQQLASRNFQSLSQFVDERLREAGCDVPKNPMRPQLLSRLQGTPPSEAYFLIEALHATRDLPGDICEFGVAQGETSALLANEIRDTTKRLHLFDSFEGLPRPTDKDQLKDDIFNLGTMEAYEGTMACSEDMVMDRLASIAFPHSRVEIHRGFVEKTLTEGNLPRTVSFAYVDLDFFEPIKLALDFLDTVAVRGTTIIVDDYDFFSTGAKTAVDEFVARSNSRDACYELRVPSNEYGHFAVIKRK
jgi:hypothetical protein